MNMHIKFLVIEKVYSTSRTLTNWMKYQGPHFTRCTHITKEMWKQLCKMGCQIEGKRRAIKRKISNETSHASPLFLCSPFIYICIYIYTNMYLQIFLKNYSQMKTFLKRAHSHNGKIKMKVFCEKNLWRMTPRYPFHVCKAASLRLRG